MGIFEEKGNKKKTGDNKSHSVILSERDQKKIIDNERLNARKTIATSHFTSNKSERDPKIISHTGKEPIQMTNNEELIASEDKGKKNKNSKNKSHSVYLSEKDRKNISSDLKTRKTMATLNFSAPFEEDSFSDKEIEEKQSKFSNCFNFIINCCFFIFKWEISQRMKRILFY